MICLQQCRWEIANIGHVGNRRTDDKNFGRAACIFTRSKRMRSRKSEDSASDDEDF